MSFDITTATPQEIVDRVALRLRDGKGRAVVGPMKTRCAYYDRETGNLCAVGALLPEPAKYADAGGGVTSLVHTVQRAGDLRLAEALERNTELLQYLQTVHDAAGYWTDSLFYVRGARPDLPRAVTAGNHRFPPQHKEQTNGTTYRRAPRGAESDIPHVRQRLHFDRGIRREWLNVTPGDAAALIYLGKTMHNEDAEAERRARRPRSVEPVPMPPPPLAPHPAEEAPQWSRGAVIAGRIAAVALGLGALVLVLHGVFGG